MSYISCIDEAYVSELCGNWLNSRVLTDPLNVDVATPDQALAWQDKLTGQPGIAQVRVDGAQLRLTFDLRCWSRAELLHRICPSAA